MKTTVLIILTVTVLIVGVLAVLNNACKSGAARLVRFDVQCTQPHKAIASCLVIDPRPAALI
jgi:hypothetical protein